MESSDVGELGISGEIPQNREISISSEWLIVETYSTPKSECKTHFSISVSYLAYLLDDPKIVSTGQKGPRRVKLPQILYPVTWWS
jgi:hypothetical protein